jgi:hypothetical protein
MNPEEQPSGSNLTRNQILAALQVLSDDLGKQDIIGEICLFGGVVMVVAFNARLSTKDVDAVFQPAQIIRGLAQQISTEQHLPASWLNDGVKGYLSARHDTTAEGLPQFPHLRLTMPVPEYLLAMKCLAARIGTTVDEPTDVADIVFLIRHLKLQSAADVLRVVGQYYPANQVPVKTQYLVEGLFEEGVL